MKKFLFVLFLLSVVLSAQENWVQEEVLFEEVDGKSYIIRIDDAMQNGQYNMVVDLCDEVNQKSTKPANKARAIVLKADALVLQKEDEEAFNIYQSAIEKYPVYIQYNDIVKKQLAIANREYELVKGRDSIFLDRSKAIKYFKKVITNAPFAEDAPLLLLRVAILQKEDDQPEEAIQSYRTLVKRYRTSSEAGYARVNLAQHYLNLLDKIEGDQRLIDESKSQLILFTQQFTTHPMLSEAQRRLKQIYNIEAERLYLLAVFYNRVETPHYRPAASKKYLYKLLIEYGDSDFVRPAQELLKTIDPDYQAKLVDEREKSRIELEKNKLILPPEATDKTKRKVIIKQGDSDKFLLPIRDLDLTPLENTDEKEDK
ncbi:MAG: tetratricopeptide repeat protein [Lentisphaeraceae bacterium]|nr:tetratricopeptide repeat protein [Lentisphaeraceae bacterium]